MWPTPRLSVGFVKYDRRTDDDIEHEREFTCAKNLEYTYVHV